MINDTNYYICIHQTFNQKFVLCLLCIHSVVMLLTVHPDTVFYEQYNKCIAIIVTRGHLIHGPVGLGPNLNRSLKLLF